MTHNIKPGCLIDHSDCYRELCHIEHERNDLRAELAHLRAQLARLNMDANYEAFQLVETEALEI